MSNTFRIKKATGELPKELGHRELGIHGEDLYYGNSSNEPIKVAKDRDLGITKNKLIINQGDKDPAYFNGEQEISIELPDITNLSVFNEPHRVTEDTVIISGYSTWVNDEGVEEPSDIGYFDIDDTLIINISQEGANFSLNQNKPLHAIVLARFDSSVLYKYAEELIQWTVKINEWKSSQSTEPAPQEPIIDWTNYVNFKVLYSNFNKQSFTTNSVKLKYTGYWGPKKDENGEYVFNNENQIEIEQQPATLIISPPNIEHNDTLVSIFCAHGKRIHKDTVDSSEQIYNFESTTWILVKDAPFKTEHIIASCDLGIDFGEESPNIPQADSTDTLIFNTDLGHIINDFSINYDAKYNNLISVEDYGVDGFDYKMENTHHILTNSESEQTSIYLANTSIIYNYDRTIWKNVSYQKWKKLTVNGQPDYIFEGTNVGVFLTQETIDTISYLKIILLNQIQGKGYKIYYCTMHEGSYTIDSIDTYDIEIDYHQLGTPHFAFFDYDHNILIFENSEKLYYYNVITKNLFTTVVMLESGRIWFYDNMTFIDEDYSLIIHYKNIFYRVSYNESEQKITLDTYGTLDSTGLCVFYDNNIKYYYSMNGDILVRSKDLINWDIVETISFDFFHYNNWDPQDILNLGNASSSSYSYELHSNKCGILIKTSYSITFLYIPNSPIRYINTSNTLGVDLIDTRKYMLPILFDTNNKESISFPIINLYLTPDKQSWYFLNPVIVKNSIPIISQDIQNIFNKILNINENLFEIDQEISNIQVWAASIQNSNYISVDRCPLNDNGIFIIIPRTSEDFILCNKYNIQATGDIGRGSNTWNLYITSDSTISEKIRFCVLYYPQMASTEYWYPLGKGVLLISGIKNKTLTIRVNGEEFYYNGLEDITIDLNAVSGEDLTPEVNQLGIDVTELENAVPSDDIDLVYSGPYVVTENQELNTENKLLTENIQIAVGNTDLSYVDFGQQTLDVPFIINSEQYNLLSGTVAPKILITIDNKQLTLKRYAVVDGVIYYSNTLLYNNIKYYLTFTATAEQGVLHLYNENKIPLSSVSDANKILTIDENGNPIWGKNTGGGLGLVKFEIEEGNLIMYYTDGTEQPNIFLDEEGHLICDIQ